MDKYRATAGTIKEPMVAEFTVTNGFVYDAPEPIRWIQGLHLGSALVRLRRMGWKIERAPNTNTEQNPSGPAVRPGEGRDRT